MAIPTTRVDLTDGEWVEVPLWLSHGQMKVVNRVVRESKDQELELETKIIKLLVSDWSFSDDEDRKVSITDAGIDALSQEKINEVFDVLSEIVKRATPKT